MLLMLLLACGWLWSSGFLRSQSPVSSSAAQRALKRGDYATALSMCQTLLADRDDSSTCLLIAGEASARLGQHAQAIEFYDRVSSQNPGQAAIARWAAGEVTLELRQMSPTIERMQQALELDPSHVGARERLIYLLNLSGQRWRAVPHLLELVQQGRCTVQHLLYLGNHAKSIENETELSEFLAAFPNDPLPRLGLARIRIREGQTEEAQRLLVKVLAEYPQLVEAHVQLGKLWLKSAPERLPAWNESLPVGVANGLEPRNRLRGRPAVSPRQLC
jgi:thioredoxin-like negative regulator of GroEL